MAARLYRGVTLIEMLVAMTIAALLLLLALPGYTAMMADAEIRNGAQSVAGGLRYAQAVAVSRNMNSQFLLAATGWTVEMVDAPGVTIQSGTFAEGASRVTFVARDFGGLPASTIAFNALGQVIQNATNLQKVDVSLPSVAGTRPLRILVGQTPLGVPFHGVKICDSAYAWPDPKGCPP